MSDSLFSIENVVFANEKSDSKENQTVLFEQYKMLSQNADSMLDRMQNLNSFFLSINSLLLTAAGFFAQKGLASAIGNLGILALAFAGFLLCWEWRRLLYSYYRLSAARSKVIEALERKLPSMPYRAQWHILGATNDEKKEELITRKEVHITTLFSFLHALVALVVVINTYVLSQKEPMKLESEPSPIEKPIPNMKEDLDRATQ